MILEDLKKMPVLTSRAIAATAGNPETHNYIVDCLHRFYKGDYGEICKEDTDYNNADLQSGYGHVLARYKGKFNLTGAFYIEAHFDKDNLNDINYTNIMVMYPDER